MIVCDEYAIFKAVNVWWFEDDRADTFGDGLLEAWEDELLFWVSDEDEFTE